MRKLLALSVVTCAALFVAAPAAPAHTANPNFLTTLTQVQPQVDGLTVQIVNLGDQIKIVNKTGKELDVPGYSGEPYLRFLPDGTVQENQNSPAKYLNEDRLGKVDVPANADENAEPVWKAIGKGGEYAYHDHRIHYMGTGTPPQVKDTSVKTKVFDWKVPMTLGGTPIAVTGTLTWIPTPDESGGVGAAQIAIALIAIVLAALLAFFLLRRRMSGGPAPAAAGASSAPPVSTPPAKEEEPEKEKEPVKEAW